MRKGAMMEQVMRMALPRRWSSRKFMVSVAAQLTGLAVLLWPEHESMIVEASRSVTALVVIVLAGLGYVRAEASVDRTNREQAERAVEPE